MSSTEKLVKISDLVQISGVKYSTLKYYSEIGILPFEQTEKFKDRVFNVKTCLKRLKEIKKLREVKRRTINEIIEYYKKEER